MKILSVNIGQKRTQLKGNEIETTGIYKMPVQGQVEIKSLGIQQDFICDQKNHGGPDQAIYIYGAADYAWWSQELGRELDPGTFGDNLTISDLESASFSIGDQLHIGSVILEVTAPRIPCSTFAARMGDPQFVKKYRYAERPGLYCRVIKEGILQVGDEVKLGHYQGERLSILEMFRNHYDKDKSEETLRRYLRIPISIRSRMKMERDLREIFGQA